MNVFFLILALGMRNLAGLASLLLEAEYLPAIECSAMMRFIQIYFYFYSRVPRILMKLFEFLDGYFNFPMAVDGRYFGFCLDESVM